MHKRVETVAKAKTVRRGASGDPGRKDTTHSRRVVFSYLKQKGGRNELFDTIARRSPTSGRLHQHPKTGFRLGDADMCIHRVRRLRAYTLGISADNRFGGETQDAPFALPSATKTDAGRRGATVVEGGGLRRPHPEAAAPKKPAARRPLAKAAARRSPRDQREQKSMRFSVLQVFALALVWRRWDVPPVLPIVPHFVSTQICRSFVLPTCWINPGRVRYGQVYSGGGICGANYNTGAFFGRQQK